jgi:hypothetical protein
VATLRDAWLAQLDLEELLAGSLNRERVGSTPSDRGPEERREKKEH